MTWNYRIIKHDDAEVYYGLHEVYYNDDGLVTMWTEKPVRISGDTAEEVLDDLLRMLKDIQRSSVLILSELPEGVQK